MCEFKVFLNGKNVAEDIIFARVEGTNVIIGDILGKSFIFKGVKIVKVDVITTRLELTQID
jgi:predicted RNA-binding protein